MRTSLPVAGLALLVMVTACGTPATKAADRASTVPSTDRVVASTTTATTTTARLSGVTIVLDPGHNALNSSQPQRANAPVPAGGFTKPCNTSGTSTNGGYAEHAYAWDVAVRAAALLRSLGARVILTRPDDRSFGPCVNERAAIANRNHAALTISIHADGAASSAYGFHVIEAGLAPDGGNRAYLASSDRLARALRTAFRGTTAEPYATYTGGGQGLTKRSDLAGLNLARVPAAFIECGNMRNAFDARRFTTASYRQKAALGVERAALAFLHR